MLEYSSDTLAEWLVENAAKWGGSRTLEDQKQSDGGEDLLVVSVCESVQGLLGAAADRLRGKISAVLAFRQPTPGAKREASWLLLSATAGVNVAGPFVPAPAPALANSMAGIASPTPAPGPSGPRLLVQSSVPPLSRLEAFSEPEAAAAMAVSAEQKEPEPKQIMCPWLVPRSNWELWPTPQARSRSNWLL